MAGKQLPIEIRGNDRATQVINAVNRSVHGLGRESVDATRKADSGFKKLLATVRQYKTLIIGAVAVLGARKIVAGLLETTREIDRLAKTAKRLDIPVERLSEMKFIADRNGQAFESLAKAVMTGQKNLADFAVNGTGEAEDAVRLLNLRLYDSAGQLRDITDLLPDIAEGMRALNPSQQTFVASKLFGRGGFEMLTTLKTSGPELRRLLEDARRYGAVITAGQAAAAERIADSMSNIRAAWTSVKASVLEQIAPLVSDTVNTVAAGIAKIPRLVGDAAYAVRVAIFGGEGKDEILRLARELLDAVGDVVVVGIQGVGRLALLTVLMVMDIVLSALHVPATRAVLNFLLDVWFDALTEIAAQIGRLPMMDSVMPGLKAFVDTALREASRAQIQLNTTLGETATVVNGYNAALTDTDGWAHEFAAAWKDLRDSVGASAGDVGGRLEELIGLIERLRNLNQAGALTPGGGGTDVKPVTEWGKFLTGVKQGILSVTDAVQDLTTVGRQLGATITQSLSQGVAKGFVDAIAGAKSFGAAMREVLSSTLRMVAELILQMLILRAIGGIFGSAAGASGGGAGFIGPVQPAARGGQVTRSGIVPAYADGGQVLAIKSAVLASVPRFDIGGLVGGARMYRDSQLIAAMPGEHVLNRRAVAMTGVETLNRANRGERLVPAGGDGGVGISVTVNVDARGASDTASVERATRRGVTEALLDSLARNPTARRRMREVLG